MTVVRCAASPSLLLLLVVMALVGGCQRAAPPSSSGSGADPTAPPATPESTAGAREGEPSSAAAGARQVLSSTAQAIARARAQGGSPCEQGYNATAALLGGLAAATDAAGPRAMPQREAFLRECYALPYEMQQCFGFEYAATHREACRAARARLDPATLRRLREAAGTATHDAP